MKTMSNHWGHCQHCKFFASPALAPIDAEEARCLHPVLAKYELSVFGACGCSSFELRAGFQPEIEQPPSPMLRAP